MMVQFMRKFVDDCALLLFLLRFLRLHTYFLLWSPLPSSSSSLFPFSFLFFILPPLHFSSSPLSFILVPLPSLPMSLYLRIRPFSVFRPFSLLHLCSSSPLRLHPLAFPLFRRRPPQTYSE